MPTGPYKYDPIEKKFVSRDGPGLQGGQVPVDPMAGPLAAVGVIKAAPVPWAKRIFWGILVAMFGVWVVLIIVWTGDAKSKGHTGLTNAPLERPVRVSFEDTLN